MHFPGVVYKKLLGVQPTFEASACCVGVTAAFRCDLPGLLPARRPMCCAALRVLCSTRAGSRPTLACLPVRRT